MPSGCEGDLNARKCKWSEAERSAASGRTAARADFSSFYPFVISLWSGVSFKLGTWRISLLPWPGAERSERSPGWGLLASACRVFTAFFRLVLLWMYFSDVSSFHVNILNSRLTVKILADKEIEKRCFYDLVSAPECCQVTHRCYWFPFSLLPPLLSGLLAFPCSLFLSP